MQKGWNREENGKERSKTGPEEDIESFEELVIIRCERDLDPTNVT
jgi:hypothetical protein